MGFDGLGKRLRKGLFEKGMLKQEEMNFIRIALPSAVMLLVICVILTNFMKKNHELIQNRIEDKFSKIAEEYALLLSNDLETMTQVGKPIGIVMSQYTKADAQLFLALGKTLCDNSDAYEVVIANRLGKGITNAGTVVDLSGESYYQDATCTDHHFYYTKSECIFGKAAIVAALPMISSDNVCDTMYLYFHPESLKDSIQRQKLTGKYMYAIVDESDNVIWNGGYDSKFIANKKYLENVQDAQYKKNSYETFMNRISSNRKGSLIVEKEGEKKLFVVTQLGIEKWYLVLGIDYDQVKTMKKEECKLERSMVGRLILSCILFLTFISTMTIIHKSQYVEHSKRLKSKAETDLLTEINNKISTELKIKEYITQNPNSQSMMFIIDVDNFKKINDTMGHAFGDQVLRTLGQKLKAEFRMSDIIGRMGGDEFVIFLKDISDDALIEKEANRIVRFINEFTAGDYIKYSATASIGVAVFPRDAKSFDSLYKTADLALYKAKKRGKNQLAFFNEIY